jgi:hypothetical protein
MLDRRGISGMTQRDDGNATLGGIGSLQPLVGIFEIVGPIEACPLIRSHAR